MAGGWQGPRRGFCQTSRILSSYSYIPIKKPCLQKKRYDKENYEQPGVTGMAKNTTAHLTAASVQEIGNALDRLEEKPRPLSVREAVAMLKPKIAALRAKGYSFDEIAAELSRHGLKITGGSVKVYTGSAAKKTTRKPRAEKIATPAPETTPGGTVNNKEKTAPTE
jgi:hypothetical protein